MLLGVDVGGTFTDAVLVGADADGDSQVYTAKVPTTAGEQAVGVLKPSRSCCNGPAPRPATCAASPTA